MSLPYPERSRKLRIVTVALGYMHPINLLFDYHDKEIVPGICTNAQCNYITNVEHFEEYGHCNNCDTYTVQSILVLSGVI